MVLIYVLLAPLQVALGFSLWLFLSAVEEWLLLDVYVSACWESVDFCS